MGLFNRRNKKEKTDTKTTKKVTDPGVELTQEDLDKVAFTPSSHDWCPKVDITPTVTIPYSKNDPHRPVDRDR